MKALIACLNTETNTFSPLPMGYRSFAEAGYLAHHGQHDDELRASPAPVFTFRRLAEAQGWEVVESLCAIAVPGGPTVRAVYEDFCQEILADLCAALPVDLVFL